MPLPHFGLQAKLIGICKYCDKEIYGFDQWRINPIDDMVEHIKKNNCKSKFREERLNKLLGK